ncbi:MAG: hypothetical protein ACRECX_13865 [Methyloceanibacter sp.]|uniref:hypothetical protein n=1 Tax=Methyloceanibacter sp. TaxID=1965321 RepID=UPI003D6D4C23
MCDYSLHLVASRPAKAGETLISTRFANSCTRGFASVENPNVAVCLRPGTELAFDRDVQSDASWTFRPRRHAGHRLARFRQINMDQPNAHHDALEFPDGQIVMLTALCEGQRATVLQLPAGKQGESEQEHRHAELAI